MATRRPQTNSRSDSHIPRDVDGVKDVAQNAKQVTRGAATSKWVLWLARFGYAAKGVVYIIIGGLSAQLAFGVGGKPTDQKGAVQTISNLPFGKFLLVVIAIGFVGFALWSLIQAVFDTDREGHKAKGIIARIGYAVVGFTYAALAFGAFRIVTSTGSVGPSSTTSTQDWTALLLKQPFGVALVVIVGLIVLGVAGYLYYRAYSANFQKRLNLAELGTYKKWAIYAGRIGYAALGVVFTIIGIFLIVAAFQHNASKAVGLDGALGDLSNQPFGHLLLGIVALGLVAYGIYSFVEARYRRLE